MRTHFETDYLVVHYDETNRIIIVEWRIPPTSLEFRQSMDIVINALVHFNSGEVIFDTRYLGTLLESDQEWISCNWYERAVKAGYSQVAFVVPTDAFTQMSVEETVKRTPNRIPTAYFDNMKEAIDWIKEI